jgi:hypothetical protein
MANQSYNRNRRVAPLEQERRRESYERQCMGKIRYLGERDASWRLNQMRERKVRDWERLELYPCRHCKGFHIGHRAAPLTPEKATALVEDFEQNAANYLGTLTDDQRKSLAAFLNDPIAITEVKTHLPWEFVQLAADALQRAGLD